MIASSRLYLQLAPWTIFAPGICLALVVLGTAYAFQRYRGSMDGYEQAILVGSVPVLVALGWFWGPLRGLGLGVGAAALVATHNERLAAKMDRVVRLHEGVLA